MATVAKDADVHVTYEDQQKINQFARVNARLQDMKDELISKQKELDNLKDAADELMLEEDEDASVPYMIGEVFVHMSTDDSNTMLENAQETMQKDIRTIEGKCQEHKKILLDLKAQLYAKFGNNINLEAEDD